MRAAQRLGLAWLGLLFLAIGLLSAPASFAQSSDTSINPADILRNIPSDQRDEILRQIGSITGDGTTRRSRQDSTRSASDQTSKENQDTINPDDDLLRQRMPFLQAGDSVIIEVDFHRVRSGTTPTAAAPAAGASNAASAAPQPPDALSAGAASSLVNAAMPSLAGSGSSSAPSLLAQEPETPLPAEEKERLQKLMFLIRSKNPYRLTTDGILELPGFPGIPLAGLTDEQASLRLEAEPSLRGLDIMLTRLPLKKLGAEALKPYGYDIFRQPTSTFAPAINVPVPAEYVIGAGDQLEVQLYGSENRNYMLEVNRDGNVNFPQLGPISVAGQRFNAVKESLEARVQRQMIGVRASVSMSDTRTIRVFVLGDANRPGSYTISGLGTMTSALFAAGGVKEIGSLRNIELRRQGVLVRRLDLYDMLIHGNTNDDSRLLPGDVIFIPSVGPVVRVDGQVRRPAIYEMKGESGIASIVQLAGGLTSEADPAKATLTHIDEHLHRVILKVDLTSTGEGAWRVRDGDLLTIARLRPTLDAGVLIDGYVYRTGAVAYHDGLRLSDAIQSVDELRPNADIHYLLIRRELPPDRHIVVLSADLAAALAKPGSDADAALMPRDRITVFDLESGRDRVIRPLLNELRLQGRLDRPTELVRVDGRIKVPGEYPLEPGMKISDLIRAGGSLSDAAYGGFAELTRYNSSSGESRRTELINIDLAAVLRGDSNANIPLQAFDTLSIKELPQWSTQEAVMVKGEVRFPGRYVIARGETLKSVVARAGGLTTFSFPEGTVFTREDLKKREQDQLDVLATRLQNDLSTLALQAVAANQGQAGSTLSVGQALLAQVRSTKAVGRLVIDLRRSMRAEPGSADDVVLHEGDQIMVPRYQQEVTVLGEVQNATSHLFRPRLNRDDYVSLSGGVTRRADNHRTYVVRADGSVVSSEGNRWFRNGGQTVMKPGDTVVVPLDTERMPALPLWQSVTSIIYNLAIAAAAVHSF